MTNFWKSLFCVLFVLSLLVIPSLIFSEAFNFIWVIVLFLGCVGLCAVTTRQKQPDGPTTHVILELKENVRERFEVLCQQTGAKTFSEVIIRAMALYDCCWMEKSKGAKIIIEKDGEEKELKII